MTYAKVDGYNSIDDDPVGYVIAETACAGPGHTTGDAAYIAVRDRGRGASLWLDSKGTATLARALAEIAGLQIAEPEPEPLPTAEDFPIGTRVRVAEGAKARGRRDAHADADVATCPTFGIEGEIVFVADPVDSPFRGSPLATAGNVYVRRERFGFGGQWVAPWFLTVEPEPEPTYPSVDEFPVGSRVRIADPAGAAIHGGAKRDGYVDPRAFGALGVVVEADFGWSTVAKNNVRVKIDEASGLCQWIAPEYLTIEEPAPAEEIPAYPFEVGEYAIVLPHAVAYLGEEEAGIDAGSVVEVRSSTDPEGDVWCRNVVTHRTGYVDAYSLVPLVPRDVVEDEPEEEPLADWERELLAPEPEPLAVGDRVEISSSATTANGGYVAPDAKGKRGTVAELADRDGDYYVEIDEDEREDGYPFAQYVGRDSLTKVEEPETVPGGFHVGDVVVLRLDGARRGMAAKEGARARIVPAEPGDEARGWVRVVWLDEDTRNGQMHGSYSACGFEPEVLPVGARVNVDYGTPGGWAHSIWSGPATVLRESTERGATVRTDRGQVGHFSRRDLSLLG